MIAKNERLLGTLDKCEEQQRDYRKPGGSYASVVSGVRSVARMRNLTKERTYAVVIRPKNERRVIRSRSE